MVLYHVKISAVLLLPDQHKINSKQYRTTHKPLYMKRSQVKSSSILHLHVHLHAQTTTHKKDPNLKQYRAALPSIQYSTFTDPLL